MSFILSIELLLLLALATASLAASLASKVASSFISVALVVVVDDESTDLRVCGADESFSIKKF